MFYVIPWTNGRYYLEDAVRSFKSQKRAQAYADRIFRSGERLDLVVRRELFVRLTGKPVAGVK